MNHHFDWTQLNSPADVHDLLVPPPQAEWVDSYAELIDAAVGGWGSNYVEVSYEIPGRCPGARGDGGPRAQRGSSPTTQMRIWAGASRIACSPGR